MEQKTITVYTRRIAYELRLRGFDIVRVVPDKVRPQFDNFVFEDSDEIRAAIEEINKNYKGKNGGRKSNV